MNAQELAGNTRAVVPYLTFRWPSSPQPHEPLRRSYSSAVHLRRLSHAYYARLSSLLLSLLHVITLPTTCAWLTRPLTPPTGHRRVTGTLFGTRHGHVSLAVQRDPGSEPVLLLEFATPTAALAREMSSGTVRIVLECEKSPYLVARGKATAARGRLVGEPAWTMTCNGRECGHALSRACGESDRRVLRTVRSVTAGAGVIPLVVGGGEMMYMRSRFERVVGGRDSEAFYMVNPDGTTGGGPELSIFLFRI